MMKTTETSDDVRLWFLKAIEPLWPVALGSVSLRKSPCVRENCSACASGDGHSSYALSGYQGDHRFSVYVPSDLAPEITEAVENGRRIQDLVKEAGVRYLHAAKRERVSGTER
jgi:molybdopterin-guanine dinucleotide biosynthesis protein A